MPAVGRQNSRGELILLSLCSIYSSSADLATNVEAPTDRSEVLLQCAQCTMTLDHGAPVEATLFLPGGSLLATAGGTEIRCSTDAFF